MPGGIVLLQSAPSDIPTPGANHDTLFIDNTASPNPAPAYKDPSGVTRSLLGATGAAGPVGPMFPLEDGIPGDDGIGVPGPNGATGPQGIPGAGADPSTQKIMFFFVDASGLEIGGVGSTVAGASLVGTNEATQSETGNPGQLGRCTSSAIGSQAGIRLNVKPAWLDNNVTFIGYLRTGPDITSIRIWIGLSATTSALATDSDTLTGTGGAQFRYSTVAGDGGWVGVTKDAGGQAVTATVATIAANTLYTLKIVVSGNGTNVAFSVNGGTAINATTHILTGTPVGMVDTLIAQVNAARTLDIVSSSISWA